MKERITNGMFMALIINMVYAKAVGLTQGSIAREVGSDMWISTLFSIFQGISVMLFTTHISKRMPDGNFIQQGEVMLGKYFGKMIALIFFVFFMLCYGTVMITFVYHLKDYFLPEAPYLLFIVIASIIGLIAIFYGLEVISRMALFGVFSILSLNILLLIGSLSEFDIRELLPTFQSGFIPTVWASRFHNTDWIMATMMAAMILPNVKERNVWSRSGFSGIAFGGMFVLMWPICEAGVLTSEVAANYIISCMQMARSAHIGLFLHRYEMIMVSFFAVSLFTQIMMSLLCGSMALQSILGLSHYRKAIIPVAIIFGGFGYFIVIDHYRAMDFLEIYWVGISMAIGLCIPALIWLLGFAFKKKLKEHASQAAMR